jgi:hypothetical protein
VQEHLLDEDIERYWNRTTAPAELLRVGDHMAVCARCRNAAAGRKNIARKVESLSDDLGERRGANRWMLAAAALLVALLGAATWLRSMSRVTLQGPVPTARIAVPRVVIEDANGTISIDAAGHVQGVPAHERAAVARMLTTGRLDRPALLDLLATPPDEIRGATPSQTLQVESPVRVVVAADRPTFLWKGREGSRFEVTIVDEKLNPVAHSPSLTGCEWTPAVPLPHGRLLMWQVASQGTETAVDPRAPARPAPFRVIDDTSRERIARARSSGSHLLLAAALAEAGLREEAAEELRALAARNPRSPIPGRLLESVEQWKP